MYLSGAEAAAVRNSVMTRVLSNAMREAGVSPQDEKIYFSKQQRKVEQRTPPEISHEAALHAASEFASNIRKAAQGDNEAARAFNLTLQKGMESMFGKNFENNKTLGELLIDPYRSLQKKFFSPKTDYAGRPSSQPLEFVRKKTLAEMTSTDSRESKAMLTKLIKDAKAGRTAEYAKEDTTSPLTEGEKSIIAEQAQGMSVQNASQSDSENIKDIVGIDNAFSNMLYDTAMGIPTDPRGAVKDAKNFLSQFYGFARKIPQANVKAFDGSKIEQDVLSSLFGTDYVKEIVKKSQSPAGKRSLMKDAATTRKAKVEARDAKGGPGLFNNLRNSLSNK
jgi:hypothetical protein